MKKALVYPIIAIFIVVATLIIGAMSYDEKKVHASESERLTRQLCQQRYIQTGVPCPGRLSDGRKDPLASKPAE